MKLNVEEISDEKAVDALFDELAEYPWIQSVSISWGGLFGNTRQRDFWIDRMHEHIPARVLVQQIEMKRLDKKGIRDMIKSLEHRVAELKEQLKGLEYS